MVATICNYSKNAYPDKSLEELQHLLEIATRDRGHESNVSQAHIRNIERRLGQAKIQQLVAEYQAGVDTTQLMVTYELSKASVLKLLKMAGVRMRHQSLDLVTIDQAKRLYRDGQSLAAIATTVGAPRETIRRALVEAGVRLRSRGRPSRLGLLDRAPASGAR